MTRIWHEWTVDRRSDDDSISVSNRDHAAVCQLTDPRHSELSAALTVLVNWLNDRKEEQLAFDATFDAAKPIWEYGCGCRAVMIDGRKVERNCYECGVEWWRTRAERLCRSGEMTTEQLARALGKVIDVPHPGSCPRRAGWLPHQWTGRAAVRRAGVVA